MSTEQKNTGSGKRFYQVFDGEFRTKVPEGTPEAIERKNKNGVMVYERPVKALFGSIEGVSVEDSDFGKQIKITLDKNEDGENPVLSFGVESKNGRDIMKKLPGIDFKEEVRIMPYRFTPEGQTQELSGISITQKDEEGKYTKKIENFFLDPKSKKYLHGMPEIDWDNSSESEQKIFKIQRDEFLVNYMEKNVIPGLAAKSEDKSFEYPDNDLDEEFKSPF